MSKISRNLKTIPNELLQSIEQNKKGIDRFSDYFGDEIREGLEQDSSLSKKPLSTISSGSDLGSEFYLDFDKLSGFSSTSSNSWSDEYESGVTKKTLIEMEKLDNIFQGIEEPCSPYCREEIEEWIELFGNISILGRVTPSNSPESSDVEHENENNIILSSNITNNKRSSMPELSIKKQHLYNLSKDCDIYNNNMRAGKMQIPEDHDLGVLKITRIGTGRAKRRQEDQKIKNKSVFTFSNKPRSLDIEKYLKISHLKSPKLNERKLSSKSLINHKVLNEPLPITEEFSSLPFLPDFTKRCNLSTKSIRTKSVQHEDKKIVDSNLILPPINLSYRSVSATPRASSKTLSALSMKYGNILSSQQRNRVLDQLEDVALSNR